MMPDEKPNEQQTENETEALDFNKPDYSFIPQGIHQYIQRGYYLECQSCDVLHAVYVGHNKILVGFTENGQPILKNRIELGLA